MRYETRYAIMLKELKSVSQSVSFLRQHIADLKEKTMELDGIE